jgi:hypothetical protein
LLNEVRRARALAGAAATRDLSASRRGDDVRIGLGSVPLGDFAGFPEIVVALDIDGAPRVKRAAAAAGRPAGPAK